MGNRLSIFDAIKKGDLRAVKKIIQNGTCDFNARDRNGDTRLHAAISKGNVEIARCLINSSQCDVNSRGNNGNTLLHLAVRQNKVEIVRCLIDSSQCDVNSRDSIMVDSPLHLAVQRNNVDIVRCLIDSSLCIVNSQNRVGDTPLHLAVRQDKVEIVRCLIDTSQCDVNTQNNKGDTPLDLAVQQDYVEIVRCLIDSSKCDVNRKNKEDDKHLHLAVRQDKVEIVRCLIDSSKFDVNRQNDNGDTPLHLAVSKGNVEIVQCLIDSSQCDVNRQNKRGDTPLHLAVSKDNVEIARCLIVSSNCDVNRQNKRGDTPLHLAISEDNMEIVRCIIDSSQCDVNRQNEEGDTPFYFAVRHNYAKLVRCLIDSFQCDVNTQNNKGDTPLHLAVRRNIFGARLCYLEIMKCLIAEGNCSVNQKNHEGFSPFSLMDGLKTLHRIAEREDEEFVRFLIKHNVDVLTNHDDNHLQLVEYILSQGDFKSLCFLIKNGLYINSLTSSGENIVHLIAKYFSDIDISLLLNRGLDFNLVNNVDNSPLMVAALLNNLPFIIYLTDLPCDVNRQNQQGHTALHLCVIGFTLMKEKLYMFRNKYYPRYLACIDILLSLGAEVNIQDNNGRTVLMLACSKNDRKLLETLLEHGADVNIVDNQGRSALQYINLTSNVYDLTCFKLLLSRGCRQSLNQLYLNGNTIIQNVLQFSPLLRIDQTVNIIKFLVFKNVDLQHLTSEDGETNYGQISLEEFSSQSRHELRQILYLSGGSFQQITQILHFKVEETYEVLLPETLREKPREKFYRFANNLSLKDICRRVIRQNTGPAIHDRISELLYFPILTDFLMFKDIDSKRFSLPDQLESGIDDGVYDFYSLNHLDLNTESDDYNRS